VVLFFIVPTNSQEVLDCSFSVQATSLLFDLHGQLYVRLAKREDSPSCKLDPFSFHSFSESSYTYLLFLLVSIIVYEFS